MYNYKNTYLVCNDMGILIFRLETAQFFLTSHGNVVTCLLMNDNSEL